MIHTFVAKIFAENWVSTYPCVFAIFYHSGETSHRVFGLELFLFGFGTTKLFFEQKSHRFTFMTWIINSTFGWPTVTTCPTRFLIIAWKKIIIKYGLILANRIGNNEFNPTSKLIYALSFYGSKMILDRPNYFGQVPIVLDGTSSF